MSVPSCIAKTWCTALAVADSILTTLLIALKLFLSNDIKFAVFVRVVIPDLKLIVLSAPSGWALSLNLKTSFPPDVVNPITFALILTVDAIPTELSKSRVNILLWILDLNVPIKLDEKLFCDDVSA